jgi:hypothetical protein
VLVLAVVAAACGTVNVAQPKTLSLAFKAGQTYKYKFHSTTKQTIGMGGATIPTNIDMSADETVTVKSVDSSGTADLTLTISNLKLKTVTGDVTNTTTMGALPASDVKIASDGHPVSFDGSSVSAGGNPFLAFAALGGGFFASAVLPDHAVKPHDTWSKTYDQTDPSITGPGLHITSNSTYLRDESVNGVQAAVVETKSSGSVDISMKTSDSSLILKGMETSDVTTWIDPTGHRIIKSHSTSTDSGTMSFTSSSPSNQIPGMSGPLSDQGNATSDLTPA